MRAIQDRQSGGHLSAASMGALPPSIVPSFAVPLRTIIHVISLLQLRRTTGISGGAKA